MQFIIQRDTQRDSHADPTLQSGEETNVVTYHKQFKSCMVTQW